MKNVLVVGMNSTEERSGGGRGALQSSLGLHATFPGDRFYYFGIESEFWRQRASHYREIPRSRWDDLRARALMRSNFLCLHIDRYLREVRCDFDVAMLGNSRLGYVAQALRPRTSTLVTYYANIEVDYIRHKYASRLISSVDWALFRGRERQCAALTDLGFFLTERDRTRHRQLYGASSSALLPIAAPERKVRMRRASSPRLAFLGSLDYRPNIEAVKYIVSEILPRTELALVLAGGRPTAEVEALVRSRPGRIAFYPNFTSLDDIVSDRDVFLSPLAQGAGMKVKVADCIAMGFPILGSPETFVGYEALPHLPFLTCCNTDDYLARIRSLCDRQHYESLSYDLLAAWRHTFSMEASCVSFRQTLVQFLSNVS